jgi:hypothetical protein
MDVPGRGPGISRQALQTQFLALVETLPAVTVQNRLMACSDRDLALSLLGADPAVVSSVLATVSHRKASRVLAELALEERRRIQDRYVVMSLSTVLRSLSGKRAAPATRSYLRPRRRDEER